MIERLQPIASVTFREYEQSSHERIPAHDLLVGGIVKVFYTADEYFFAGDAQIDGLTTQNSLPYVSYSYSLNGKLRTTSANMSSADFLMDHRFDRVYGFLANSQSDPGSLDFNQAALDQILIQGLQANR